MYPIIINYSYYCLGSVFFRREGQLNWIILAPDIQFGSNFGVWPSLLGVYWMSNQRNHPCMCVHASNTSYLRFIFLFLFSAANERFFRHDKHGDNTQTNPWDLSRGKGKCKSFDVVFVVVLIVVV